MLTADADARAATVEDAHRGQEQQDQEPRKVNEPPGTIATVGYGGHAEATGKVKTDLPESEDDIEVDETLDDEDDDSTFIAEEEEGEDDVTDIIGDVTDDEES